MRRPLFQTSRIHDPATVVLCQTVGIALDAVADQAFARPRSSPPARPAWRVQAAQFFAQRFHGKDFCKPMFPGRVFAGFACEKPSFGEAFV
jgi:hypothetical protein